MKLRAFAVLGLFAPLAAFAACQGEINPQPLPPGTSSSGGEFTPGRPSTGTSSSSGGSNFADAAAPAPTDDAGGSFDSDASSDAAPDAPILDAGPDSSDATTD